MSVKRYLSFIRRRKAIRTERGGYFADVFKSIKRAAVEISRCKNRQSVCIGKSFYDIL
jgi:uncharacterized membrane protein YobD (UPF0266 family)